MPLSSKQRKEVLHRIAGGGVEPGVLAAEAGYSRLSDQHAGDALTWLKLYEQIGCDGNPLPRV